MAHLSEHTLAKLDEQARFTIEVGAVYHHYTSPHKLYTVVGIGFQEATDEPCVIYRSLTHSALTWIRPVTSWLTNIEHEGTLVTRFRKVV